MMKKVGKYTRRVFLIALLAVVVYMLFLSEYDLFSLLTLKREAASLQTQITKSETERAELLTEIEKLKNDDAYIEQIAREQFKMGKEGERIYIFKDKDSQ